MPWLDLSMLPWTDLSIPCRDPSMPWPVRSRGKPRRRGGLGWDARSAGLWAGRSPGLRESRGGLRADWRDCETRCVRCQSSVAFSHLLEVGG